MRRLAPLLVVLAACAPAPTATVVVGGRAEPALLRFAEQDAVVTVPDTVAAGSTFTVVAATFGGGCVRAVLAPVVRVAADTTVVALFNHDTGADACTDDLLRLEHRVTLPAGGAGRRIVRLEGGHRGAATGWRMEPWAVVRTVVVR